MVGEADVTIRYAFLPTESSIKAGAEKIEKEFKKRFEKINIGGTGGSRGGSASGVNNTLEKVTRNIEKSTKKTEKSFDTFDFAINTLRATQEKTSLQTKLSSAQKLLAPLLEPIQSTMERLKLIKSRDPAISPTGIGQGEGGENIGQVAAGGGIMGALGTIAALLIVIAVAMTLISAFFDAVGPIIKVVMKMFSAMILILLMPFLKRGLPVLFDLLKWMISMSKGLADFADSFMTYIEKLLGKAMGGDISAIFELLFVALTGPLGMLVLFLGKELVKFLGNIDWGAIVDAVIPMLTNAFEIIKGLINTLGTSVFGLEIWAQIKEGIKFIQSLFTPEGLWKQIEAAIDWIGTTIFGETTWSNMRDSINHLIDMIFEVGNGIVAAWNLVLGFWLGRKGTGVARPVGDANPFPNFGSGDGDSGESGGSFSDTVIAGGKIYNVNPETGGLIAGAIGTAAQDFISRPGGGMMPFSPDDTIIGMKNPEALGGINITNHLTVSAGVDKGEFRKILAEFNRQQAREMRTRTSYYGR